MNFARIRPVIPANDAAPPSRVCEICGEISDRLKCATCVRRTVARRGPAVRHGHNPRSGDSPTYHSWACMIQRCTNPKRDAYPLYGGRGITVCARWRESFDAFLADMGPRPAGTSIDRIDSSGDYEPGNCRWSTPTEQAGNTSRNRLYTMDGRTMCLAQWAKGAPVAYRTIVDRMNDGWALADAIGAPQNSRPRKLTAPDVAEIRQLIANGLRDAEIAPQFGICRTTVFAIRRGRIWANQRPGSKRPAGAQ